MKIFLRNSLAKLMLLALMVGIISPTFSVGLAQVPQASIVGANIQSNGTFNPAQNTLNFGVNVTQTAKVAVFIRNLSTGLTEKDFNFNNQTFEYPVYSANTTTNFSWNGTDKNGNQSQNGQYQIEVLAFNTSGTASTFPVTLPFILNRSTQSQTLTAKINSVSQSTFDPSKSQSVAINYTVSASSDYYPSIRIYYPDSNYSFVAKYLLNATKNSAGNITNTISWNGTVDPSNQLGKNGTYKIVLTNENSAGNKVEDVAYVTINSTPAETAPVVTNVTVNKTLVNVSDNSSISVCYTTDKAANIQVSFISTTNSSLFYNFSDTANGGNKCSNLNLSSLPNGTFSVRVTASLPGNGSLSTFAFSPSNVTITRNQPPAETAPVVTNVTINKSVVYPETDAALKVCYITDKVANINVFFIPVDGSSTVNVSTTYSTTGGLLCVTPNVSTSMIGKSYFVRVRASNTTNSSLFTEATSSQSFSVQNVNVDPSNKPTPKLIIENSTFNPNVENNRFRVSVDMAACVKIQITDNSNSSIYRTLTKEGGSTANLICQSNEDLLMPGTYAYQNDYQYQWNGRNDNNTLLNTGTYKINVTARNQLGPNQVTGLVYLNSSTDDNSCTDLIGSTYSTNVTSNQDGKIHYSINSPSYLTLTIVGEITLLNSVYNNADANNYVLWDGKNANGYKLPTGNYTYKLRAEKVNQSNCFQEKTGTISITSSGGNNNDGEIDPDINTTDENLIKDVKVLQEIFNPKKGESSTVRFTLSRNADVKVQVMDGNRVIRTLSNVFGQNSGTYSYNWNGYDWNGNLVSDKLYQYRITARDGNDTDVDRAYTEVDTDGYIIGFPESYRCAGFRDVSIYSPLCKAIEQMKKLDIFTGYDDGTFRPYRAINRAEATKVIVLALGYTTEEGEGSYYAKRFSDTTNNAWYSKYLEVAYLNNIIHGYPDGTFRPANTINRVELLKVFLEATQIALYDCGYAPFSDTPYVPSTKWYMPYACFVKTHNLLGGALQTMLRPAEMMTRGDVADLFYEFEVKGLFNESPGYKRYSQYPYNEGYYEYRNGRYYWIEA